MNIKRIVVGELQENCYIIENNDSCIIIDPGAEAKKIINNINKKVIGILITHNHFDHVGALDELMDYYHVGFNEIYKDFKYEVINTLGHTMDSKTYYFPNENVMFTGDFIFKGSIGRTDLGGNNMIMKESLSRIIEYPNNIIIYPGHGDKTTLGQEKSNIKYFIEML